MVVNDAPVVFFDIGDTLGSVHLASTEERIERIDVFPHIFEVLGKLTKLGARLGVISNRGGIPEKEVNRALLSAGLYVYFEPDLVIYGRKDSVDIFNKAAEKAGPNQLRPNCLFVGENESERSVAEAAGFLTAGHPATASEIVSKLISDDSA